MSSMNYTSSPTGDERGRKQLWQMELKLFTDVNTSALAAEWSGSVAFG